MAENKGKTIDDFSYEELLAARNKQNMQAPETVSETFTETPETLQTPSSGRSIDDFSYEELLAAKNRNKPVETPIEPKKKKFNPLKGMFTWGVDDEDITNKKVLPKELEDNAKLPYELLKTVGVSGAGRYLGDATALVPNLPFHIANMAGYDIEPPVPYPSSYLAKGINRLEKELGYEEPTTGMAYAVRGVGDAIGGNLKTGAAKTAAYLGKNFPMFQKLLNTKPVQKFQTFMEKITPKTARDWAATAAAGAASGYAGYETNDNPLAKFLAATGAGILTHKMPGSFTEINPKNIAQNYAKRKLFEGLEGEDYLPAKQAAEELGGLNIRPSETTGNPIAKAGEASAGTTIEGAKKLHKFNTEELEKQKGAVKDILRTISPSDEKVYKEHKNIAQEIVKEALQERQKKASPLYDKSFTYTVPEDKFNKLIAENPIIEDAVNKVKKDVTYKKSLQGFEDNSLKVLHLAQMDIEDRIQKAAKNEARLLRIEKNNLLDAMDEISPDYKKARSLYAEDSPAIEELTDSHIGKIQNLDISDFKRVPKLIFDPTETDLKTFTYYKNKFYEKNPKSWNTLTRNYLENELHNETVTGATFYKKFLANDDSYKRLQVALENNPSAAKKLELARDAFKYLNDKPSLKIARDLELSADNLNKTGTIKYLINKIDDIKNGLFDKELVDLITKSDWDKDFEQYVRYKGDKKPLEMIKLLNNMHRNLNSEKHEKIVEEKRKKAQYKKGGKADVKVMSRKESLAEALKLKIPR